MGSNTTWALACAMLSFSGFVFLLTIGVLVKVQPQYMKIAKNVDGPASVIESACLYGTLFVASTVYWYKENQKETAGRISRSPYQFAPATAAERRPLLSQ